MNALGKRAILVTFVVAALSDLGLPAARWLLDQMLTGALLFGLAGALLCACALAVALCPGGRSTGRRSCEPARRPPR